MNPDAKPQPKRTPPAKASRRWQGPAISRESLRKALIVTGAMHVLIILWLAIFVAKKDPKPPEEVLTLLPLGMLAHGTPGLSPDAGAPAPPAPPTPTPPAPQPTPPAPPKQDPAPTPPPPTAPEPKPEPQPLPQPKPDLKPTPKPEPKPTPTPQPPKPPAIKLKEITRPAEPSTEKPKPSTKPSSAKPSPSPSPPATDTDATQGLSAADIKSRLQAKIGKGGVASAQAQGPSGSPDGRSTGGLAIYYALIRDVFYDAWHQPSSPPDSKLKTTVRIQIAADGKVLSWEIVAGSGHAAMDQTVRAAASSIDRIPSPLPPDLLPGPADVSIVFEL